MKERRHPGSFWKPDKGPHTDTPEPMHNARQTTGYNAVMSEIRSNYDGDGWGMVMHGLGVMADAMYMHSGEILPEYSPSIMHSPCEVMHGEEYRDARWLLRELRFRTVKPTDIRAAYAVLNRYADWVRLAGEDY